MLHKSGDLWKQSQRVSKRCVTWQVTARNVGLGGGPIRLFFLGEPHRARKDTPVYAGDVMRRQWRTSRILGEDLPPGHRAFRDH